MLLLLLVPLVLLLVPPPSTVHYLLLLYLPPSVGGSYAAAHHDFFNGIPPKFLMWFQLVLPSIPMMILLVPRPFPSHPHSLPWPPSQDPLPYPTSLVMSRLPPLLPDMPPLLLVTLMLLLPQSLIPLMLIQLSLLLPLQHMIQLSVILHCLPPTSTHLLPLLLHARPSKRHAVCPVLLILLVLPTSIILSFTSTFCN